MDTTKIYPVLPYHAACFYLQFQGLNLPIEWHWVLPVARPRIESELAIICTSTMNSSIFLVAIAVVLCFYVWSIGSSHSALIPDSNQKICVKCLPNPKAKIQPTPLIYIHFKHVIKQPKKITIPKNSQVCHDCTVDMLASQLPCYLRLPRQVMHLSRYGLEIRLEVETVASKQPNF